MKSEKTPDVAQDCPKCGSLRTRCKLWERLIQVEGCVYRAYFLAWGCELCGKLWPTGERISQDGQPNVDAEL